MKRIFEILLYNLVSVIFGAIIGVIVIMFIWLSLDVRDTKTPLHDKGYRAGYYRGYNNVINAIDSVSKYKTKYVRH